MSFLMSKWAVIPGALVLLLIALLLIGRKSVQTQIHVHASPDKVWSVITETEKYSSWNPVFSVLDGKLEEGGSITYHFRQNDSTAYDIETRVLNMITERRINQAGGMKGILTFNHNYTLEPQDGGTLLTISEEYRGIAVPFWSPSEVEQAYARLCQSIKNRVSEAYPNE